MALMTTATSGLSSAQVAFVFSKKLLDYAKQRLVMDQFGDKAPFPKGAGTKTLRWLRPDAGDRSQVQTLTEGVPLATYREIAYTAIEATLAQYGEVSKFSDILSIIELYPTLRQSIDTLGQDAAMHADFLVMTEVVTGVASGQKMYAQGIANYTNLKAASASGGALTIADILRAMTKLEINRAPRRDGEFVLIVSPQVAFDLMQDTKFINAGVYGTTQGLFRGEVGRWYGVRVIMTTQAWTEGNTDGSTGTEGTYAAGGGLYASVVTGRDAYGIPEMASAGGSEFAPKIVINDKPDKSDNLNQFITCGWKAFWAVKTLNNTWSVVLRSKSTFA